MPAIIDWTPALYSRLAKRYDGLAKVFFSMGETAKGRVAEEFESGSVLDIACGTGALLALARDRGLQCYGTDLAPGMVAVAQEKVPEGEFRVTSFYDLPYPDASFDTVAQTNAVSGVMHNPEQVLAEMVRVCRPGGQVLIGDYCQAPKPTLFTRIMARIGSWIGDQPYDYAGIFRAMGSTPEVELLGWGGIYQFIRVEKEGGRLTMDDGW